MIDYINTEAILFSLGCIFFGFLLKQFYKNGAFDNSIYLFPTILGILVIIFDVSAAYSKNNALKIRSIDCDDIDKIVLFNSYNIGIIRENVENEECNEFCQFFKEGNVLNEETISTFTVSMEFVLSNGNSIYIMIWSYKNEWYYCQQIKFLGLFLSLPDYSISNKISNALNKYVSFPEGFH